MPLSRLLIQGAVKCPKWQEFRLSLKSVSTQAKLDDLLYYLQATDWRQKRTTHRREQEIVAWKTDCECDALTRQVQVLNYLTALSRGGQLDIIASRWQYVDQVETFLRDKRYVIRR